MVTTTNYGDVTVMSIKGDLCVDTGEDFAEQRDRLLSESRSRLVIDCASLTALDSSGLELLNATRMACEEQNGTLKICSLDEIGRKIFEITRLERQFEIHDDLDSAVRSFS
jgi:anti-sigma B factor antagonist